MSAQASAKTAKDHILWLRSEYGISMSKLAEKMGLPNRNYVYAILNAGAYRRVARLSREHFAGIAKFCRDGGCRVTAEDVRMQYEHDLRGVSLSKKEAA